MSIATFSTPLTKARRASSAPDPVLTNAIEAAERAVREVAGAGEVGEHLGAHTDGQRLTTHFFASSAPGYRGWQWAVTLARAPRARTATVCEVVLLPGDDAIVAPAWVPWSERLQPGDVGRHDVLAYVPDDDRLEPGYEETGDGDSDRLAIDELGLGRVRVLSPVGLAEAASRWYTGDRGPVVLQARDGDRRRGGDRRGSERDRPTAPAAQCATCGFLLLMAGSMRTMFGVCANEWSPDDGRVVSLDHGCGSHSETDLEPAPSDWPANAPVIDDHGIEVIASTPHDVIPEPAAEVPAEPVAPAAEPERAEETAVDESPEPALEPGPADETAEPSLEPERADTAPADTAPADTEPAAPETEALPDLP